MAQCHEWLFQSASFFWIFTLLLSESQSKRTQIYYMQGGDCGSHKQLTGAVVYSHVRSASAHELYSHGIECQLTFQTQAAGWRLMLRVIDIDIPDKNRRGICNDALYIYDGQTIFTQVMKEAGGNRGLCGESLPPAMNSTGEYLTVHFRTDSKGPKGKGFKFIVTAFNEDYKKSNSCGDNFLCDNGLCIDHGLVCDRVDHCGDLSDEAIDGRSACETLHVDKADGETGIINKFLSLGVTASVAITVGSVVVVIVVVVAVVCLCRRSACRKSRDTHTAVTTTPTTVVSNGNSVPYQPPAGGIPGFTSPTFGHHGYCPMQPVYPSSGGGVYLPFPQRESYCHPGNYSSQPPSYHRSYTPTSSKSGKSNTSVTYSQGTDKVMLPVNL